MRKSQKKQNGSSGTLQRFTLSKKLGSEIKAVEKQTHLPMPFESCCLRYSNETCQAYFL